MLYIPHGSDNTYDEEDIKKDMPNFISHMVQIIRFKDLSFPLGDARLYIPHGSDNTGMWSKKARPLLTTLYPTWFR